MNLVLFAHPDFLSQQSMPRFTRLIFDGMVKRGHDVQIWQPKGRLSRLPFGAGIKKWLGYIDQFILFPIEVRKLLKKTSDNTLFVFTDHALGPWVPLVAKGMHVLHCHDFLAQKSALGEIPEHKTRWSGKLYQNYIRKGYLQADNFISVSNKTKKDLHRFMPAPPKMSRVVYNGLNQSFVPGDVENARQVFGGNIGKNVMPGYLLHVGNNSWYKNRVGVIEIYSAWRRISTTVLPLLLIGTPPSDELQKAYETSPYKEDIHFLDGIDDELIKLAYQGATVFIFPSIAEGFGWPIAEAMASGCPVITTNEAPMTEVAGNAGFLVPRRPMGWSKIEKWAIEAGKVTETVVGLSPQKRQEVIELGIINAKRFDPEIAMNKIEMIYLNICKGELAEDDLLRVENKPEMERQEDF